MTAIIIGMTIVNKYCFTGFEIALKLMLGINTVCLTRFFYHLIILILKKQEKSMIKSSLDISNWVFYILFYGGTIFCYVVFAQRPDDCFKGKFSFKFCIFNIILFIKILLYYY